MKPTFRSTFKALITLAALTSSGTALASQCYDFKKNKRGIGFEFVTGIVGSSTLLNHPGLNGDLRTQPNQFQIVLENASHIFGSNSDYKLLRGKDGTVIDILFDVSSDGTSPQTLGKPDVIEGTSLVVSGGTLGFEATGDNNSKLKFTQTLSADEMKDYLIKGQFNTQHPFYEFRPRQEIDFPSGAQINFALEIPQLDMPSGFSVLHVNLSGHVEVCGKRVKLQDGKRAIRVHMQPLVMRDGKVGIGVQEPEARLDVNGDVKFSGDATLGGNIRSKALFLGGSFPVIEFASDLPKDEKEKSWTMVASRETLAIKDRLLGGEGIFLKTDKTSVTNDLEVDGQISATSVDVGGKVTADGLIVKKQLRTEQLIVDDRMKVAGVIEARDLIMEGNSINLAFAGLLDQIEELSRQIEELRAQRNSIFGIIQP